MIGDMKYEEMLLRVGTRVQVSLRIPSDELKRYLAHDLDDNLYRLIGEKIADGREYIVKVLDTHSELDEYGYCRIYGKEAIVALRNWRDAKPGDAVWVTNEEDKMFSLHVTFIVPKPLDTMPDYSNSIAPDMIARSSLYNTLTFERTMLRYKDSLYRFWICKA